MTSDVPSHRLVFLHGFTQTHHHWHECAALIGAATHEPTRSFIDLPGHGLSAGDVTGIADSGAAVARLGGAGTYIGYSMGGRYALVAASRQHPEIERLVLIGATGGIDSDDERDERRRSDAARAIELERDGVATFLDRWMAAPMFADLPDDPLGRRHRERNTAAGLAASLRLAGTGSQPVLWHALDRIEIPVLVIAGARDDKFTALGRRLADELSNGEFVTVEGAGHAAHIERPVETAALITAWLGERG